VGGKWVWFVKNNSYLDSIQEINSIEKLCKVRVLDANEAQMATPPHIKAR
jgi:hypothetical protein